MKSIINELWHGNVCPQTDSRNNSPEMKELMEYMARHHDNLLKTMTDEQKEIFEKFHVAKSKTIEYRFLMSETAQSKELTEPSKHRRQTTTMRRWREAGTST